VKNHTKKLYVSCGAQNLLSHINVLLNFDRCQFLLLP